VHLIIADLQITMILQEMNDINVKEAGGLINPSMKSFIKKPKSSFENEIVSFMNTYKQVVKDVQDLNHFAKI